MNILDTAAIEANQLLQRANAQGALSIMEHAAIVGALAQLAESQAFVNDSVKPLYDVNTTRTPEQHKMILSSLYGTVKTCRDCDTADLQLYERHGHFYCGTCYMFRFGTAPEVD